MTETKINEDFLRDGKELFSETLYEFYLIMSVAALETLLCEDFDAKSYASSIIHSQTVGETLGKLSSGIAALNKELSTQVTSNYEDLLSQATGIEALESVYGNSIGLWLSYGTSLTGNCNKISARENAMLAD